MATFIGFSTQHADNVVTNGYTPGYTNTIGNQNQGTSVRSGNKYTTTDQDLVIQDFINSLNIQQGTLPGRPDYGTNIYSYIFEPNTTETKLAIDNELKRMVSLDPRIVLNTIQLTSTDTGIIIQMEIAINPFLDPLTLSVYFDQASSKANLVTG